MEGKPVSPLILAYDDLALLFLTPGGERFVVYLAGSKAVVGTDPLVRRIYEPCS